MALIDILAAVDIVKAVAAAEAMPRWRNLAVGDIVEKNGPDDLVTVADQAVEAVLSERLRKLMPGSDVVGEEAVHADPALLARLRDRGVVWVIDPIDGTSNFAAGDPGFAVMVALIVDGVPVAGILHAPALARTTYAQLGAGAWDEKGSAAAQRLSQPASVTRLDQMVGIVGKRAFVSGQREAVLGKRALFKDLRPNSGCAGTDYPEMAAGNIHFALYSKSEPWDHLPGLAILAEQGFYYARHDGSPYLPGDNTGGLLVSSGAQQWPALRDVLLG